MSSLSSKITSRVRKDDEGTLLTGLLFVAAAFLLLGFIVVQVFLYDYYQMILGFQAGG